MLPVPWKPGALVRLFASVIISAIFLSASASSVLHLFLAPAKFSFPYALSLGASIALLLATLILIQRRGDEDRFIRRIAWILGCFYAAMVLLWVAGRFQAENNFEPLPTAWRVLIAVASFQGSALVLVNSFLREHGTNWREAFGLQLSLGNAIGFGVAAGLASVPLMNLVQMFVVLVLRKFGMDGDEQEAVRLLRDSPSLATQLVMGLTAIVIAPVAEEVLFRGVLYPALLRFGSRQLALWVTAILFSLIHGNLTALLPLALISIGFTILYERTQNLLAPVLAHMVFNASNFIMLFLMKGQPSPLPE